MNNQLIEKVIKCNNEQCPPFLYENPLIDKNVSGALSKSLVKILKVSSQNSSNNNLRLSALENIRRLCQVESENHFKTDENFTELLTRVYENNIKDSSYLASNSIDRLIDAYLMRSLKDIETNPDVKTSINPEIVQSLNNLNENGSHLAALSKEIIHWRSDSKKSLNVLKDMWSKGAQNMDLLPDNTLDDISIKMKQNIEQLLIEICCKCLENENINLASLFSTEESLVHLIKTSSTSQNCYQICYNIFNDLFLKSNYAQSIQKLISEFVSYVKIHCNVTSFSSLYSSNLCHIALLLDIHLSELSDEMKDSYIETVISHLIELHKKNENDLILILSHFPKWFNIYFEQVDVSKIAPNDKENDVLISKTSIDL